MIIPLDAGKVLDKINCFMIKNTQKTRKRREPPQHDRGHLWPTNSLHAFSSRTRTRPGWLLSPLLSNVVLAVWGLSGWKVSVGRGNSRLGPTLHSLSHGLWGCMCCSPIPGESHAITSSSVPLWGEREYSGARWGLCSSEICCLGTHNRTEMLLPFSPYHGESIVIFWCCT